jgi:hypothetical protein
LGHQTRIAAERYVSCLSFTAAIPVQPQGRSMSGFARRRDESDRTPAEMLDP